MDILKKEERKKEEEKEEKLTLDLMPTEIIQKIIYTSISAQDFINLGMASKEMMYVCNLICYPGVVQYSNIKSVKNNWRFKSLHLDLLPDPSVLESLNPELLIIDLDTLTTEAVKIPDSVLTLEARSVKIILSPETNKRLKNIILSDSEVIGSIPKTVIRASLDNSIGDFEDPSTIVHFISGLANAIIRDDYVAQTNDCYSQLFEKMTNLEELRIRLMFVDGMVDTFRIPHMPKLRYITVETIGTGKEIFVDFDNTSTLEGLNIFNCLVPIKIVNPPTNLTEYNYFSQFKEEKFWNNTLNISAKNVNIYLESEATYIPDYRVQTIKLCGKVTSEITDNIVYFTQHSEEDIFMIETKNIEQLELKARTIQVNTERVKDLYVKSDIFININDSGKKLETVLVISPKVIGDLSDSPLKQFLHVSNSDITGIKLPKHIHKVEQIITF